MSGSLKIYGKVRYRSWAYCYKWTEADIDREAFPIKFGYQSLETKMMWHHQSKVVEAKMRHEREIKVIIEESDDKHLLFYKDIAPVAMAVIAATILLPDGSKAVIEEITCDIEGNVVYYVDKVIVKDNLDSFYNAVDIWLMNEFPDAKTFNDMIWRKDIKVSDRDLELEDELAEYEIEYEKFMAEYGKKSNAGSQAAERFNRSMRDFNLSNSSTLVEKYLKGEEPYTIQHIEYGNNEIKVGNGKKNEVSTSFEIKTTGDMVAYTVVGALGGSVVMLIGKLLMTVMGG